MIDHDYHAHDNEADKILWNSVKPRSGVFAKNTATTSHWLHKTPPAIIADMNLLFARSFQGQTPDRMFIPYRYIYPAPIRFRVTGKRSNSPAIERERVRQSRGLGPRKSIFEQEWFEEGKR